MFRTMNAWKKHGEQEHGSDPDSTAQLRYVCAQCKEEFETRELLGRHGLSKSHKVDRLVEIAKQ